MADIISMIGSFVAGLLTPIGITGTVLVLVTAGMFYFTYKKKKIPIVSEIFEKGKVKTDARWVATAALVCAVITTGALGGLNFGALSAGNTGTGDLGYRPLSVALTISPKDIANSATAVGGTVYAQINGGPWIANPATYTPGDQVNIWVSNRTTYDCQIYPVTITNAASIQTVYPTCAKNASITLTAYDTTNHKALVSQGAGGNVSVAQGGSVDIDWGMQGQGDASTGVVTKVFELSNRSSQDVAKTQLTQGGVALASTTGCPTWYTAAGVNSGCVVVTVPAVTSSATNTIHMNVPSVSASVDMSSATIKMSTYANTVLLDSSNGAKRGMVYAGVADSGDTIQSIAKGNFTVTLDG